MNISGYVARFIVILTSLLFIAQSTNAIAPSNKMATFFGETKAAGTTVQISFDKENTTPKYALGYWSIRGLGAPLTMMLCAAKVPFTLFLFDIVEKMEGEDGWTSDYFAAKPEYIKEHGAPMWNLPFCVDRENEFIVCQTNAVFSYFGRACGMFGSCTKTTSQCEQLLCEIYDLRNIMVGFAYGSPDTEPASVLTQAKKPFQKLEAWLELQAKALEGSGGDNKKVKVQVTHLVGGKFSAPDFHLYEMLDQFVEFSKHYELEDLLDDYPRLKDFFEGFAALE